MTSRFILAALTAISLSLPLPAFAQISAAPWPIHAQGRDLPRPEWVLAIPARRQADGRLIIWDRSDSWTQAWRVPTTINGLRVVTLLGDTEDRRSITAEAIDGMLVNDLAVVMRKYGAPAIALAVTDGTSTAVAGYVPGWSASWLPVPPADTADSTALHAATIRTVATLFDGAPGGQVPNQPAMAAPQGSIIDIEAFRINPSGGHDYRILVWGGETDIDNQLDTIAAIPGLRILSETWTQEGAIRAEIEAAAGLPDLRDLLISYGLHTN